MRRFLGPLSLRLCRLLGFSVSEVASSVETVDVKEVWLAGPSKVRLVEASLAKLDTKLKLASTDGDIALAFSFA